MKFFSLFHDNVYHLINLNQIKEIMNDPVLDCPAKALLIDGVFVTDFEKKIVIETQTKANTSMAASSYAKFDNTFKPATNNLEFDEDVYDPYFTNDDITNVEENTTTRKRNDSNSTKQDIQLIHLKNEITKKVSVMYTPMISLVRHLIVGVWHLFYLQCCCCCFNFDFWILLVDV